MKKRVLFIDRDGTIIVEPKDTQQIDSLERLEFIPGAITALARLAAETDFELVMVTNQDGLGTSSFPEDTFWPAHNKMMKTLEGEGIRFSQVCIDRSFAHENKPTRKPGTGMLTSFFSDEYDLAGSYVIGDRLTDVELAKNLGAKGILFAGPASDEAVLRTSSWDEIYRYLVTSRYTAAVERVTKETSVSVSLTVYGQGRVQVRTGLGFFDHMLDLFGHHAGFDLVIDAKGDLHVDEHHLIEDVGITLGDALRRAIGDKAGMHRYGFLLPMDEALSQIALDLSGRSHLEWNAEFRREKVGDVPTEMFKHFFRSLSDGAKISLHIAVTGENEHHKAEALFKGVARALRMALTRDRFAKGVPSTKGVL